MAETIIIVRAQEAVNIVTVPFDEVVIRKVDAPDVIIIVPGVVSEGIFDPSFDQSFE